MNIPTHLACILSHKQTIAIFGNGVASKGVQQLLQKLKIQFEIFDETNGNDFEKANTQAFHLVVYSPGFPQDHKWLIKAKKAKCCCMGELDFSLSFWPGEIIAITGTNGKTSLTEFIMSALRAKGKTAFAVGNNGTSVAKILTEHAINKNSIAVCEVSSFQSASLRKAQPNISVFCNFATDHLNVHKTEKMYFAAKWNLLMQTKEDIVVTKNILRYMSKFNLTLPNSSKLHIVDLKEMQLPLKEPTNFMPHAQKENFAVAKNMWKILFPTCNGKILYNLAHNLGKLPYRLCKTAEIKNFIFWNDAKSTNLNSLTAALENFSSPIIWIGGGISKKENIPKYAKLLHGKIEKALLIGETARTIQNELNKKNVSNSIYNTLSNAIYSLLPYIKNNTMHSKHTVLFSPGFASFDMFENYLARGKEFENVVLMLKNYLLNLQPL